jgi:predicted metal-dependent hydrolase
MSNLEVRKIPFDFDGAEFIWNPANPAFSIMMNQITFLVIGFEKYLCKAIRAAEPLITDPVVAEEAKLFFEQEAVHAMAHRKHAKALIDRYPGLQHALDRTISSYDELLEEMPLEFALAYGGGLESVFTPFFKMILDNRDVLFGGGDSRLSSLFLWHFCEEIEHRSSALMVYDHVVGRYWYRIRNFRKCVRHVHSIVDMLREEFIKHVPGVPAEHFESDPLAAVPRLDKIRSMLGIIDSQMPWHNPENQALPAYYEEWLSHWKAGDDMTDIYGKQAGAAQ